MGVFGLDRPILKHEAASWQVIKALAALGGAAVVRQRNFLQPHHSHARCIILNCLVGKKLRRYAMPIAVADTLLTSLHAALASQGSQWANAPLERLKDKGLAHDHVRLCGTCILARIPKQSQLQLSAQDNLAYQCACFERASAAGHAPHLRGVLPPSLQLPRGALLVEEIVGRNAALPGDLGLIVQALASIHALPLPAVADRHPLINALDPLHAMLDEVSEQARHVPAAAVGRRVEAVIQAELERLRKACAQGGRPPRHLIAFDGHPGNFIIRGRADPQPNRQANRPGIHQAADVPDSARAPYDGALGDLRSEAVLVDLEKCRYSYPGLDLAHATLYTSTTWDLDSYAVLEVADVVGAYATWGAAVGAQAANAAQAWHVPLRRAMWLWSITWCAKWRAVSGAAAHVSADGEDWSTEHSGSALVAHVRGRVDHYLSPAVVGRVLAEFDALDQAQGA